MITHSGKETRGWWWGRWEVESNIEGVGNPLSTMTEVSSLYQPNQGGIIWYQNQTII